MWWCKVSVFCWNDIKIGYAICGIPLYIISYTEDYLRYLFMTHTSYWAEHCEAHIYVFKQHIHKVSYAYSSYSSAYYVAQIVHAKVYAWVAYYQSEWEDEYCEVAFFYDSWSEYSSTESVGCMAWHKSVWSAVIVVDVVQQIGYLQVVRRTQTCYPWLEQWWSNLVAHCYRDGERNHCQNCHSPIAVVVFKNAIDKKQSHGHPYQARRKSPECSVCYTTHVVVEIHCDRLVSRVDSLNDVHICAKKVL